VASISSPPIAGKAKKPSPEYQRATVRYRCPPATPGRVYVAEDLEYQRGWLQDLSVAGIGLLMSKPLARDLHVTIQLKSVCSEKTYSLAAHVVHATQQSSGEWVVGCLFVDALSLADLDDLL
jgi:PilZ domain